MEKEEILTKLEALQDYFSNNSNVEFIYVFGSILNDTFNINSDVDIAIMYKDTLDYNERLVAEIEIEKYISKVITSRKIDISSINDLKILMRFEIVTTGKLLYEKDEETTIMFNYYTRKFGYDEVYRKRKFDKMFIDFLKEEYEIK